MGLARRAARALAAPPVMGAAYMLLLVWRAGGRAEDQDLGDKAQAVGKFIESRFQGDIHRIAVAIGAAAVALGLLLGLLATGLMHLRSRRRRGALQRAAEGLGLVVALHSLLVLHAMAESPQLYAATWYAEGGLPRTVQILASDLLGPRGIVVLGLLAAGIYLVGPRGIRGRLVRIAAALGRLARGGRGRAAVIGGLLVLGALFLGEGLGASAMPVDAPAARAGESGQGGGRGQGGEGGQGRGQGGRGQGGREREGRRPNVLILAADSLRADRLEARTAPVLTRLAEGAARFDRAYVSVPRTFSSWVNILTGRHAHHHGVRSMFPRREDRAKDFDAMPSRFAREGYRTAVVGDYAADIFGRIDLGFERVDTPSFDFRQLLRQRALERETPLLPVLHSHMGRKLFPVLRELSNAADAELLADDAIAELRRVRGSPFFLTVFFSTAHFPYAAPSPYYRSFTDPGYRGRFKYHKPVGLGSEAPPDQDDIRQIRALYDGAVLSIDTAIGRVLRALRDLKLSDDTIVVITADHGETLYDNGHGQGHGDHLFGDEGTHVPLLVRDPRRPGGRRIPDVVRDVDLAPTLYALAGVSPPPDLDGRSLVKLMEGSPLPPAFAYAETELWFTEEIPSLPASLRLPYPGIMQLTELDSSHGSLEIVMQKAVQPVTLVARHRMVRDARWKLVYLPTRAGVKYMLFDTVADPGETLDVLQAQPAEAARLQGELWRWMLEDRGMTEQNGMLVPKETSP